MMKKLLLLAATGCIALGASAQQSVVLTARDAAQYKAVDNGSVKSFFDRIHSQKASNPNTGNKTTVSGGQWYVPHDMINKTYLSNALDNNRFVFVIGYDGNLKQRFVDPTTGPYYDTVNWFAVAQFVDPIYSQGFLNTDYAGTDGIDLLAGFSYQVDSVFLEGAYVKNPNRPTSVVDTLIISVTPVPNSPSSITKSTNAKVVNYDGVSGHGDVLKVQNLPSTDPITHTFTGGSTVVLKQPLVDSLRTAVTTPGSYSTRGWTFALPSALTIPANNGFAVSVTFKPGETWAAGDSVQAHHYFMPTAGYGATGSAMPYFYYTYNDHNMSYLMHYSSPTSFASAVSLEMANTNDYSYEFFNIGGHVLCSSCWTLNSANVNMNLSGVNAYPNPATGEINIAFNQKNAGTATVKLTNAVGQVLQSQNVANGKAAFSTANMANGLYFYTVEANGETKTGRVVVAH